LDRHGW